MFDPESATSKRMQGFENLGARLTIIVVGSKRSTSRLEGKTFDLVTAQDPLKCGFVGMRLSKKFKIPLEIQMHGDWFGGYYASRSLFSRVAIMFAKKVLKRATIVRAVSSRVAQSLIAEGIPEEKIYVAPISIPPLSSVTELPEPYATDVRHKKIILCVGRLSPEKHVDLLAHALPAILGSVPDAVLVVAGEGNERAHIQAVAKSLGCREQLLMVGAVDDVSPWYYRADVVVIPSYTESFSRVVIEATAANKPIVMTDVGLAGDVIIDRVSGRVVPIDNPGLLAEAVIETLASADHGASFVQAARAIVKARFSHNPQEISVARWKEIIH